LIANASLSVNASATLRLAAPKVGTGGCGFAAAITAGEPDTLAADVASHTSNNCQSSESLAGDVDGVVHSCILLENNPAGEANLWNQW
jgi:hypothetical protein